MFKHLVKWLRHKQEKRIPALRFEQRVLVSFDDSGISATFPDGAVQDVLWREIDRIAIETNDSGPWGADVWWLLEGNDKKCFYPLGASGESEVFAECVKRFPGFKVDGMNSTSNARFVCWERK